MKMKLLSWLLTEDFSSSCVIWCYALALGEKPCWKYTDVLFGAEQWLHRAKGVSTSFTISPVRRAQEVQGSGKAQNVDRWPKMARGIFHTVARNEKKNKLEKMVETWLWGSCYLGTCWAFVNLWAIACTSLAL